MGRRSRKGAVLATVFLFALSSFFGIMAAGDEYEPRGGKYGGELRVGLKGDIEENPLLADDDASLMTVSLLYDSLARIDSVELMATPWVATHWNMTSNTTVDVHIRTDVEWHDSTDENPEYITVEDINYTFCKSGGMKSSVHWGSMLANVDCWAVDSDTVHFDLTNAEDARAIFFSKILTIPIIPENFTIVSGENGSGPYKFGTRGSHTYVLADQVIVDNASTNQDWAVAAAHYHYINDSVYDDIEYKFFINGGDMPTGWTVYGINGSVLFNPTLNANDRITANYTITSQFTTIVAFEEYFIRRPYLDAINYTFYPDNPTTGDFDEATDGAQKAMIDGILDFIGFPLVDGSQDAVRWEGSPDQTQMGSKDHTHIFVQTKRNPKFTFLYLGMNTTETPLDDPLFRKGVSMSIKRELSLKFQATAYIADSVINPYNPHWYNETIPRFRVPKDEDNNPIYIPIINHFQNAGYLDPDEDGYMETPTGANFSLRLFIPTTVEDLNKNSIGTLIGETFQDIGIDTEIIPLERDVMMEQVEAGNFSFYLTTYDVEADPIFLYDILHPQGTRNYVRLNDPFLNDILENVSKQLNQETRRFYVEHALGWIAENAPIATILHYKVLEVYEGVKYYDWVQMPGGVNNFWSYMNVHYKQKGKMKAQLILLLDSINAGETLEVMVSATDLVDTPLPGAWVKLTNTYSDEIYTNYTDVTGHVYLDWVAPDVSQATTVTFTARVRVPQYDEEIVTNSITVHPLLLKMAVSVSVDLKTITSGQETEVLVEVTDDFTLLGIPGATVLLTISPEGAGGTLEEFTGVTDSSGWFTTTFTADVTVSTLFTIKATAYKDGYAPFDRPTASSVLVNPVAQPTPGFEAIIVAFAVLLAVVIVAVWARRRPRKGEK
jgi:ABC-type oligopeptide transport system substrate-binding subunit